MKRTKKMTFLYINYRFDYTFYIKRKDKANRKRILLGYSNGRNITCQKRKKKIRDVFQIDPIIYKCYIIVDTLMKQASVCSLNLFVEVRNQ